MPIALRLAIQALIDFALWGDRFMVSKLLTEQEADVLLDVVGLRNEVVVFVHDCNESLEQVQCVLLLLLSPRSLLFNLFFV